MDQVHREDLAHLKTNIDPRHYRDPCQYYDESFLMSAVQPRLLRNSTFGAGLISDALPPLGGTVGDIRRPGPAWWSRSSPRKRGSCCIACVLSLIHISEPTRPY